jgi:hypothetical protein
MPPCSARDGRTGVGQRRSSAGLASCSCISRCGTRNDRGMDSMVCRRSATVLDRRRTNRRSIDRGARCGARPIHSLVDGDRLRSSRARNSGSIRSPALIGDVGLVPTDAKSNVRGRRDHHRRTSAVVRLGRRSDLRSAGCFGFPRTSRDLRGAVAEANIRDSIRGLLRIRSALAASSEASSPDTVITPIRGW